MDIEKEILKNKIYILEKINKVFKGKYKKELEELKKELEELKKADKDIWEE